MVIVVFVNFVFGVGSVILHAKLLNGSQAEASSPTLQIYDLLFSFGHSIFNVFGDGGEVFGLVHGLTVIAFSVLGLVSTWLPHAGFLRVYGWAVLVELFVFLSSGFGKIVLLCDSLPTAFPLLGTQDCSVVTVMQLEHLTLWGLLGLYAVWIARSRAAEVDASAVYLPQHAPNFGMFAQPGMGMGGMGMGMGPAVGPYGMPKYQPVGGSVLGLQPMGPPGLGLGSMPGLRGPQQSHMTAPNLAGIPPAFSYAYPR